MSQFVRLWRAILRCPGRGLVETQLSKVHQRVLDTVAGEQADLVRDERVTREQALAAIAQRFPELTPDQVSHALARGFFLSR